MKAIRTDLKLIAEGEQQLVSAVGVLRAADGTPDIDAFVAQRDVDRLVGHGLSLAPR